MITRKELKKNARQSLKHHLLIWLLLCLGFMFLSGESLFDRSVNLVTETASEDTETTSVVDSLTDGSVLTSSSRLTSKYLEILRNYAQENDDVNTALINDRLRERLANDNQYLGRTRGVLASIVNRIDTGSLFVTLGVGVNNLVGSRTAAVTICIIGSIMLYLLYWIFFKNILRVLLDRMFLEGRHYEKIHMNRLLFVFQSGHWFNVSMVMLLKEIQYTLWSLTIVGAVIKRYSYFLVPYIVAENPTISPKKAIKLSRDMMNGHKWECFLLELSFIGWWLLDAVTFGIADIVFIRPYQEASFCEFYAALREQNMTPDVQNIGLLNDKYLYDYASQKHLDAAYSDVVAALTKTEEKAAEHPLTGIYLILQKYFGITLRDTEAERESSRRLATEQKLYFEKEAYTGKVYPARLYPLFKYDKEKQDTAHTVLNPLRPYSIWSLILIYFTMCVIGWVWEGTLHLIEDGGFVNRGVLHGPWLPIYGTGGILILVLLYSLRKNPLMEFIATIVVCGVVEYFTAYYLEVTHDGMHWWDYSGYFLNLHGRICAEGLLIFGIGGMLIVYLLAPLLDNLFRKIPFKLTAVISVILIALFLGDQSYSSKHPNMGAGITDYDNYIQLPEYLMEETET